MRRSPGQQGDQPRIPVGQRRSALSVTTCEDTEEENFDQPSVVTPHPNEVRVTKRDVASESHTEIGE